jgi:hypothetical protein
MEIPKDQILEMLRGKGKESEAQQADQELPDQVDTEKHGDLLSKFGLDAGDLAGGLKGKLGL